MLYYKLYRKVRNNSLKKDKYYALCPSSNILIKKIILDEETPGICIRSFVPKSFINKEAKKKKDNRLIPTKRAICFPTYFGHHLITALKCALPPQETLETPEESFFGDFKWPINSKIVFPDGFEEITSEKSEKESESEESGDEQKPKRKRGNINKKKQQRTGKNGKTENNMESSNLE